MSIQQRKETFADFAVSLPLFSLPQKLSKSSATEAEAKENNFSDGNKHLIASPSPFLTQNEAAVRGRKQFPSFVAAEEWNTLHNPPSFDAMPSLWNSSHSIYTSPNSHHPQAAQQQFALRPSHSSQSRPSAASKASLRSFHGNEERLHGSTTFHHLPSSSYSYDLLGTHPSASSTNHTNALLRLPFASKDPYALLSNTCVSKTSSKKLSTHYSSLDGSADTAEAHSNYTLPRFAPFVSTASTTSAVATPTLSLQDNPSTAYTSSPSLPSLIKPSNHLVTPQKKQENLSETSTFCNVLDTAPKASILPIVSSNSDKGVKHPPANSICSNKLLQKHEKGKNATGIPATECKMLSYSSPSPIPLINSVNSNENSMNKPRKYKHLEYVKDLQQKHLLEYSKLQDARSSLLGEMQRLELELAETQRLLRSAENAANSSLSQNVALKDQLQEAYNAHCWVQQHNNELLYQLDACQYELESVYRQMRNPLPTSTIRNADGSSGNDYALSNLTERAALNSRHITQKISSLPPTPALYGYTPNLQVEEALFASSVPPEGSVGKSLSTSEYAFGNRKALIEAVWQHLYHTGSLSRALKQENALLRNQLHGVEGVLEPPPTSPYNDSYITELDTYRNFHRDHKKHSNRHKTPYSAFDASAYPSFLSNSTMLHPLGSSYNHTVHEPSFIPPSLPTVSPNKVPPFPGRKDGHGLNSAVSVEHGQLFTSLPSEMANEASLSNLLHSIQRFRKQWLNGKTYAASEDWPVDAPKGTVQTYNTIPLRVPGHKSNSLIGSRMEDSEDLSSVAEEASSTSTSLSFRGTQTPMHFHDTKYTNTLLHKAIRTKDFASIDALQEKGEALLNTKALPSRRGGRRGSSRNREGSTTLQETNLPRYPYKRQTKLTEEGHRPFQKSSSHREATTHGLSTKVPRDAPSRHTNGSLNASNEALLGQRYTSPICNEVVNCQPSVSQQSIPKRGSSLRGLQYEMLLSYPISSKGEDFQGLYASKHRQACNDKNNRSPAGVRSGKQEGSSNAVKDVLRSDQYLIESRWRNGVHGTPRNTFLNTRKHSSYNEDVFESQLEGSSRSYQQGSYKDRLNTNKAAATLLNARNVRSKSISLSSESERDENEVYFEKLHLLKREYQENQKVLQSLGFS